MNLCNPSNFTSLPKPHNFSSKPNPTTHIIYLQSRHNRPTSISVFSTSFSVDRPNWENWESTDPQTLTNIRTRHPRDERGFESTKVNCEVEVVSWRERRVNADILVHADIDSVWNALTDYDRLADFIPNLVSSGTIPCPHPGRIWLEQRGLQRALYWHIEARVVLDLQEFINSENDRELRFSMVDGDFKKFQGRWCLKSAEKRSSSLTNLSYEVNVIPRFNFPAIFLEKIVRSDLPVNLQALACRAETQFGTNRKDIVTTIVLPQKEKDSYSNGTGFVPLPPSSNESTSNWGAFGKSCRLDRPHMVDEVHFRRFDGLLENGGVHRGVFASITVKAPVREVWNVLTSYESLPEIVPNLAISKILSRDNNRVRILQEGCKGLLYMVLHARVVLDLCEELEQEISFEQVEGDFHSFQGKWILEQLGSHHTLLKYSVESKMHQNSFLSEAIMEEVIYEDLPSNLCAIRDFIEERNSTLNCSETYSDNETISSLFTQECDRVDNESSTRQRSRVPGLQRDFDVLKSELLKFISENGKEGFMPMRKQLRKHGRVDIEKAITRMGGFRRIASTLNLSLAYKHRKPKGYWDNLDNLQDEILRFQKNWGMDGSFMPSRKSFERAGRYDIARALEKWGGVHEVSRLLCLKSRRQQNREANMSSSKEKKTTTSDGGDHVNGMMMDKTILSKTFVSQDTQKWIMKLKDLDIDWVQ
ncbi:uncharacterized protein LOC124934196 [Impatiens glandulifera]|uniref:uncharacterized protein LOC124934196 n=1 Tax=Impatiens glandulifera TaxID=253017 RepID=UPI001FB17FB1|nr:uncharacterized protein LOC124934196 [Impatiens glandulifera]